MAKKLVRDFVPELVKRYKKNVNFYQIKEEDQLKFLKSKLLEEVRGFIGLDSYEELIDMLEVIDAISIKMNVNFEKILKMKKDKRDKMGGYYKGIIIISCVNE